jgi:hypothetical protein
MYSCPVTLGACLIIGVYIGFRLWLLIATVAFASSVCHSFYTSRSSVFRTCRIKARHFELGSILQQILDEQRDIRRVESSVLWLCEILCSQGGGYMKTVVCWYVTVLPFSLNLSTYMPPPRTSPILALFPYIRTISSCAHLLICPGNRSSTILDLLTVTIQTTRCHICEGYLYTSLAYCWIMKLHYQHMMMLRVGSDYRRGLDW